MSNGETVFSVMAVALLLVTMAWGNATVMMIASALGLVLGSFAFLGRKILARLMLTAFGLGAAAALVVVMILRSRGQ